MAFLSGGTIVSCLRSRNLDAVLVLARGTCRKQGGQQHAVLAYVSAASGVLFFAGNAVRCQDLHRARPESDSSSKSCQTTWERTAKYFRGFRDMTCGLDIGGTTAKFAVLQRGEGDTHVISEDKFGWTGERVASLETACPALGGTLHFIKWFTEYTDPAMELIREFSGECDSASNVFATGGGAYRFGDKCRTIYGWNLSKIGEFDALVDGLRFIFDYMPDDVYCIQPDGTHVSAHFCHECFKSGRFPVLVCNIGTGVSMIKVASDGAERIGGTSVGGSTFLGLVYQLTSANTFAEAMQLAQEGDAKEVDLLVRDIYGEEAQEILGIPGDMTASSFGRLTRRKPGDRQPSEAAMAASVCIFVTQAIALYACQLARRHSCRDVIFTGGFLEENEIAKVKLAFFVQAEYRRHEGEGRALFLRHAEYAGSLGCLSQQIQLDDQKKRRSSHSFSLVRTPSKRLNH